MRGGRPWERYSEALRRKSEARILEAWVWAWERVARLRKYATERGVYSKSGTSFPAWENSWASHCFTSPIREASVPPPLLLFDAVSLTDESLMVWFVGWFCILIWMLQLETLFKRTVHPDTLLLNFSPFGFLDFQSEPFNKNLKTSTYPPHFVLNLCNVDHEQIAIHAIKLHIVFAPKKNCI